MIYQIDGKQPQLDPQSWVAPGAKLIGDVQLKPQTSIWFNAVLRADNAPIVVGQGSNVQDGCVLHTDPGFGLTLAKGVTVGHQAMLHGCDIGEHSLIGIHATVLNGAKIGAHCLVGAHALVTEGQQIPDGSLVLGAPAKVVRPLSDQEKTQLQKSSESYIEKSAKYKDQLNEQEYPY